jgi:hypothetical protein
MAKQNQRKEVRQEARQAAQAGTFGQSNVQAMRQAGVQPQAIQNIREVARQAPAASAAQGVNLGYGVTNTGSPGGLSMPGGTNAAGQPIPASQASNVFKLNIPFSTAGVTNIMGNPMNNFDTGFQVVGDGVNWQDPKNAGLLGQYTSPEAINNHINTMWAMSSANPNRDANMAAFMDSGSAESLITGRPPTAMPTGFTGLYNPAMTGLNTPWSQQYAAANSGAGGSGNAGGAGTGGNAMSGGGGGGAGGRGSGGNASSLGQAIRAAGAGGISKGELNQMLEGSGKSGGGAVIQRLDQINRSLKEKDRTGISLNSGAANMLIKQAGPSYGGMYGLTQKPTFGTGSIGKALEGMRGTRATGGYQNPQSGYGEVTAGTAPKRMMGGTAIRPGGRETVRGFGKQFTPRTAAPIDTTPVSASTTDTGGGGGMDMGSMGGDTTPMTPEDMKVASTAGTGFGGFGSDVFSSATGFKAKRSSRKTAGPRAQGLGSQRVSPTYNTLGL